MLFSQSIILGFHSCCNMYLKPCCFEEIYFTVLSSGTKINYLDPQSHQITPCSISVPYSLLILWEQTPSFLRLPYIVKRFAILKFISSDICVFLYLLYVDIDGAQRGFALVQSANKAKSVIKQDIINNYFL